MKKNTAPKQHVTATKPKQLNDIMLKIQTDGYLIAMDKYLGIRDFVHPVTAFLDECGPVKYDFNGVDSSFHGKEFSKIEAREIQKYAKLGEKDGIIFILDGELIGGMPPSIKNGHPCYSLNAASFEAAITLNAYLYADRKLWTSHLLTNIWAPLPVHDGVI